MRAVPVGYPQDYLTCPICSAGRGQACRVQSGRLDGGRPDGVGVDSDRPHVARRRSARAGVTMEIHDETGS